MTKILFVCHSNICRSPMAEFVMKDLVKKAGLEEQVKIASAATSREEIGNDVHPGTKQKLREMDIPFTKRHARQITKADYKEYDYIIGMDHYNLRNMKRILGEDSEQKISLLYQFVGVDKDIADPWYTGNFDETYKDVEIGCKALLKELKEK
ncbi:MAG: low molecular weight protein-tyrosine-phosphatase [bacterium]|nr:low molecular weight protein-tyrosine-phosphatase [bacterium]